LAPGEFAALLNDFYRTATSVIVAHDGLVDKMIGDEVMALFVPGLSGKDYRKKAVHAAQALMHALGYDTGCEPSLPVGAAVHAGIAYVGNVGVGGITDFTALGDTVNTAARLQGHAAARATLS
jgi:adenylate cyclase